MGFHLSLFNEDFECAFENVLQVLHPRSIMHLAGNGYHLHESLRFLVFLLAHVRRRDEVTGGPESLSLDGGCSSDDEIL